MELTFTVTDIILIITNILAVSAAYWKLRGRIQSVADTYAKKDDVEKRAAEMEKEHGRTMKEIADEMNKLDRKIVKIMVSLNINDDE